MRTVMPRIVVCSKVWEWEGFAEFLFLSLSFKANPGCFARVGSRSGFLGHAN
jgi:hypothetical protein